ncbi:MAG: hypothetical protein RQ752_11925, partial [Thermohalobaculum sp.]|nr:hypothetical protein [Thermohalobaculum sp.]
MVPDGAPYGLIPRGAVLLRGGRIAWAGAEADLPGDLSGIARDDAEGRLITPALIDCHTHLVFGGNRAREFEMRLEGATYEQIARAGGGIVSTVAATRAAGEAELLTGALPRLDALIAEGVATIEIKSGYGLDAETELRMLRVARMLGRARPVRVRTTYLGAHAIPPDYAGWADAYLDEVCLPTLDAAAAEGLPPIQSSRASRYTASRGSGGMRAAAARAAVSASRAVSTISRRPSSRQNRPRAAWPCAKSGAAASVAARWSGVLAPCARKARTVLSQCTTAPGESVVEQPLKSNDLAITRSPYRQKTPSTGQP